MRSEGRRWGVGWGGGRGSQEEEEGRGWGAGMPSVNKETLGIQGRFSGFGQSVKLLESCCGSDPSDSTASAAARSGRGPEIKGLRFPNAAKCQIVRCFKHPLFLRGLMDLEIILRNLIFSSQHSAPGLRFRFRFWFLGSDSHSRRPESRRFILR